MNLLSRGLAAGCALIFTASAGAVAAEKKKTTITPLSAAETQAGINIEMDNGRQIAGKTVISFYCSDDRSQQFVVPITFGYDLAKATAPAKRLAALESAAKRAQSIFKEMVSTPPVMTGLMNGMGDGYFMKSMGDFNAGLTEANGFPVGIIMRGPIVHASGCGTIHDKAQYEEAKAKFGEILRARMHGPKQEATPTNSI